MKKTLKKFFVTLLAVAMVLGSLTLNVGAEGEEYDLFIAIGANEDWSMCYAGEDLFDGSEVNADITVTNAKLKVGETATVSLEFANPIDYCWYMAPTLVAPGVSAADFTVECYIDGTQVDIDASQGDAWWYEATGSFSDKDTIRIAGGCNEWGANYIAQPSGCTKVEYKVTCNSLEFGGDEVGELADFDGEFESFLAFACNDDWGVYYYNPGNAAGVTQEPVTAKVGDTFTLTASLDETCGHTWFIAPVIVAEGVAELEYEVTASYDGADAEIDFAAGDPWWYEATGDYDETKAIRLAGGYNEWGTQYIPSPEFKEVTYTITVNSMKTGVAASADDAADADAPAVAEFDPNGSYNAYIGFQSPQYSFRNAWYDQYGLDYTDDTGLDYFHQLTGWDGSTAITLPGTFTDAVIAGNGTYTVSADGLEFLDGEFDAQDHMNIISFSTDIPKGAVEISDVTLKINGSTVELAPAGALISPEDTDLYVGAQLQNIWNDEITTLGYYATPVKSISITFTVSGFDYDNEAAAADAATDTAATDTATTDTAATEAPADTATATEEKGGIPVWVWIVGGVVVVGGGAGAAVAVSKKKKN